jgi:hypothetical protein
MKCHKSEFILIKKSPLTPLFQRGDFILSASQGGIYLPLAKGGKEGFYG